MTRYLLLLSSSVLTIAMLGGCMEKLNQEHSGRLIQNDHPMVGKIWDVKRASFIGQEQLLPRLLESRYLLLGETHDNISHHKHQAEIISALSNAGVEASVHFEMIDDSQYEQMDLKNIRSLSVLMDKLNEAESGWYYEQMYKGIFEQVIQAGYELLPANLNHGTIRKIIKQGEKQTPGEIKKLLADVPLSGRMLRELEQDVIKGHCNALPEKMVAPMILAQRVRDARMSLSLLHSSKKYRVLIAGSGHTRKDRAVPVYLAAREPQAKITSIGFFEVLPDQYTIDEYFTAWEGETVPFDYIWLTPRYDREDPCEQFSKMLKK